MDFKTQGIFFSLLSGPRSIAGVAHFCPSRPRAARVCCTLEQGVFFCAVLSSGTTLFFCTLWSSTQPQHLISKDFSGHGYFYWKMRNMYNVLFSFSLPHSSPFLPPSISPFLSFFSFSLGTKVARCLE